MEVTVATDRTRKQDKEEHMEYLEQRLGDKYWFDERHSYVDFYIYKRVGLISSVKVATIRYARDPKTITVQDKSLYDMLKTFGEKFGYSEIEKDYPGAITENRIRTGKAIIRTDDPGPYTKPAIPEAKEVKPKNVQLKKEIQACINNLDIIIENTNNSQRIIELRDQLVTTLNKLPKEIRKGWSSRMYKANELLKGEQ